MRAARYYGKEDIRIEQVPEPELKKGEIKLAPAYVGICGTDLHEYLGGPNFAPVTPHPITKDTIPVTFGHELSGVVKDPGDSEFNEGDKIVVRPSLFCSSCAACSAHAENVCHSAGFIGLSGGGGGLADYLTVPASYALKLPDNVPLDVGALVEPLAVAWHATAAAPLNVDDTALIMGGGPIGLAVVQCLRAQGLKNIIVAEIASRRQEFAKSFGAAHVINPISDNVVEISRKLSNGTGPDVVFDCAGVPASLKTSCNAVKARGTVVNVAIWEKEVPFNPCWLVFKEASYTGVLGYQHQDWIAVLEHLRDGSLRPENMITSKISLEDLIPKGFMPLINEKESHVKILVDIQGRDT
ncbi:chlorophyll synthesis pathway protein BchC [Verruconis gallopava]|uniref:Chlorophyll synthesis pathway protein BchC n=1 Tax=Verruconis gallopava TaxID=253628 RepID=A0A0D1YIS8_9PEZI|nr:chlorophyll synthesis pathway protein BchC [Verruconis gallopava]KIW00777.1 chlorophyll synthesis pathway protein BchC [Verruconis gallopava]